MSGEGATETDKLTAQYQTYASQKCFVGHSLDAEWCDDLISTCQQVLPEYGMEPWFAAEHFDPTRPLREKIVELIANTRYGIYDISYWRKDDKSEWIMPRNVLIEFGIAIALNRPILLLRSAQNRAAGLPLPTCLESLSDYILEFSGSTTLRRVLKERLSQWIKTDPEQDWWNRYCIFGNRVCQYREVHPHIQQWRQGTLHCHISDGPDTDRPDFRGVVEEVLERFDDVTYLYLDALPMADGYDFLLCTHCQTVRSTPFAIYRITPHTHAETFIAIGMNLALEAQFTNRIPKILLTANTHDIPSLLAGYEVVVARNDKERLDSLRKFMPEVIQHARKTTWKPRPLPFIEILPSPGEPIAPEDQQGASTQTEHPEEERSSNQVAEENIGKIGKYGLLREIGRGSFAIVYLARDTETSHMYALKVLLPELMSDSELMTRFQREAQILASLNDPHLVQAIEFGKDNNRDYIVMDYIEGQNLRSQIGTHYPMELLTVLNYTRQAAEGLDTLYRNGIVHRNISSKNIIIDTQGVVKIISFFLARSRYAATITQDNIFMGEAYYNAPEQAESSRTADTRSDLYSLTAILYEMLTGRPPFQGETAVDIIVKHMNYRVPSINQFRPKLPPAFDAFIQKAMAKSPAERYQTPREFIAALDRLEEVARAMPPNEREATEKGIVSSVLISDLEKELADIQTNKEAAANAEDYYRGAMLRQQELMTQVKLDKALTELEESQQHVEPP